MPLKLTALPDGKIQIEGGGIHNRAVFERAIEQPGCDSAMLLRALGWDGTIPEPVRVEKFPGPWVLTHADDDWPLNYKIKDQNGLPVAHCVLKPHADAILALQSRLLAAEKVVEAARKCRQAKTYATQIPHVGSFDEALAAYDAEVGGK